MKQKNLLILVIATALVIVIAALVNSPPESSKTAGRGGELLLPGLLEKMNDVGEISIRSAQGEVVLQQQDGHWGVQNKHGYHADVAKIRSLVYAIANFRIEEEKTANADLYNKIDVDDPAKPGAKGIQVALKDQAGAPITSIILGRSRNATSTARFQFVRLQDQAQSWLVRGEARVATDADNWIDKGILDIKKDDIQSVTLHGKPALSISRSPADGKFAVSDIPAGKKLKSASDLETIAGTLQNLTLEDVLPQADFDMSGKNPHRATYTTTNGLQIELTLVQHENHWYVAIQAQDSPAGTETAKESTDAPKLDEKAKTIAEATTINDRTKGWIYVIRDYKAENLTRDLASLLE